MFETEQHVNRFVVFWWWFKYRDSARDIRSWLSWGPGHIWKPRTTSRVTRGSSKYHVLDVYSLRFLKKSAGSSNSISHMEIMPGRSAMGSVILECLPHPLRNLLGMSAMFASVIASMLTHSTHKSMSRAATKRWNCALTWAIVLELLQLVIMLFHATVSPLAKFTVH